MGQNNGKPVVFTDQVNLNHFRLLRVVGKGAFGKVRIVERKDTGLTFALKYIRKDEVVRSESVRNIIRERRMLEHLNHPFLCNLRYSFQDIEYLYIVVDLMNGGDLRFHISRKTFTEEAVRFWIAQLGCAVRYIHQQGIVHRDIKPDNVLLDSEGHVHLADFNVASDFTPHKPLTSKSGTLAYLAPEVYEGKGYSCEVDWWSLGVLFYECIYNKRPFEANSHDSLAAKIAKGEPTYPVTSPSVSMPCLHAISSLLEKNRKKRIGAIGFESFADNPFFRPLDFIALEAKEIPPVFIPSSDKTNFDATYDLEELLLEEAPLEARARRQKPREALKDDATDAEIRAEELHRMIETLFEPFNYTTIPDYRPIAVAVPDPADSVGGSRASNQSNSDQAPVSVASQQDPWGRPLANSKSPESDLHPNRSITTAQSTTHSANGSPPLANAILNHTQKSSTGSPTAQRGEHSDYYPGEGAIPTPSFSRPMNNRPRGSQRSTSMGGGVQVVLNETGSWSEMANQSSALLQNPQAVEKPSGMLGFLNRKKGRDRSPKAKERGVIGKEGARVIISNT
ncbi:kinase-like protein [Dothidotthia symphoricarpi CBS 119687]|uniref:Kinase-like protein n=1 Tax=Dothidotthia symphoricarpi CBS 119687 TaxID=1392245 RepID=A0A6A6AHT2_9PLEO|nr:kinase-like protein [Dothidotthia symphoricarpi CBS 119687]KAF2130467.1 kinase-like protein [Dothidotthia symphoricarpi CBS 119687]